MHFLRAHLVGKTIAKTIAPDDHLIFGKTGTTGAAFEAATERKKVPDPTQPLPTKPPTSSSHALSSPLTLGDIRRKPGEILLAHVRPSAARGDAPRHDRLGAHSRRADSIRELLQEAGRQQQRLLS